MVSLTQFSDRFARAPRYGTLAPVGTLAVGGGGVFGGVVDVWEDVEEAVEVEEVEEALYDAGWAG